jgi:hypothetical protein
VAIDAGLLLAVIHPKAGRPESATTSPRQSLSLSGHWCP